MEQFPQTTDRFFRPHETKVGLLNEMDGHFCQLDLRILGDVLHKSFQIRHELAGVRFLIFSRPANHLERFVESRTSNLLKIDITVFVRKLQPFRELRIPAFR